MTAKEAITYLSNLHKGKTLTIDELEAIDIAIHSLSVNIPAGLDGAAEFDKIFDDFYDQHPDGLTLNECAEFFYDKGKQAGAEWMAGQFQKIEGELVDWYGTSDGKDYCCGVKTKDAFEVPEGFYIRKK